MPAGESGADSTLIQQRSDFGHDQKKKKKKVFE
jgi:hypothetical protein